MSLDVTTLARHYFCPDCEVGWHDVSSVCWACERDVSRLSYPLGSRDAAHSKPEPEPAGTPLTRHGPRTEPTSWKESA